MMSDSTPSPRKTTPPHQTDNTDHDSDHADDFSPNGTLIFVGLMLTGYVIYWFFIWYLVVIERN